MLALFTFFSFVGFFLLLGADCFSPFSSSGIMALSRARSLVLKFASLARGHPRPQAPGRPDGRGCRGRTRHPLAAIRTVMDDLRPALCEYCSPLRPIKTPRYFCASLCVQESSARAPNLAGGCNSWRGVLNSTRDSRLARSRLCTSGRRPCINTLPLALRRGQECSQAASFNP